MKDFMNLDMFKYLFFLILRILSKIVTLSLDQVKYCSVTITFYIFLLIQTFMRLFDKLVNRTCD